jgi:hypothetical protein
VPAVTTTGVAGRAWRATITAWGAVQPWSADDPLDWFIAADDRWHSPMNEVAVRQHRIDGAPVVETRVRIPGGDAVQRVYSIADHGGMTIVQVTNESSLPIAVAFTRGDVKTSRPAATGAPPGIDLPPTSIVMPVGHQATVTVALAHDGSGAGPLPQSLPPAQQIARAWTTTADRAGRYVVPDESLAAAVIAQRCELVLSGPAHPDHDSLGFLIGVGQLVRMGERAEPWMVDVAEAVELTARSMSPTQSASAWRLSAALDGAAVACSAAGERRAVGDLRRVRDRLLGAAAPMPALSPQPTGLDLLAWIDAVFADRTGGLFPLGLPDHWLGSAVEAYDVPLMAAAADARLAVALRWHGARPAALWEVSPGGASAPVTLTAPTVAPGWATSDLRGETLWPVPPNGLRV